MNNTLFNIKSMYSSKDKPYVDHLYGISKACVYRRNMSQCHIMSQSTRFVAIVSRLMSQRKRKLSQNFRLTQYVATPIAKCLFRRNWSIKYIHKAKFAGQTFSTNTFFCNIFTCMNNYLAVSHFNGSRICCLNIVTI